jgi:prepilin-type N-terminal cleavage/methylation domain-containing protein
MISISKHSKQIKAGFTLFEILLVIAAISVLAVIIVVAFNPVAQIAKARMAQRMGAIDALSKAIDRYDYDQTGFDYDMVNEYSGIDLIGECPQCEICISGDECEGATDLTFLAPKYIKQIPENPSFADAELSGYYAYKQPGTSKINILAEALNGFTDISGTYYASYRYLGTEPGILSKFATKSIVSDGGINVFSDTRQYGSAVGVDAISVDTSSSYKVEGEFKSTGLTLSRFYFGVIPLDKDKGVIEPHEVQRVGNAVTISSYNSTQIVVTPALSGWYNSGSQAYQRVIGFYYDGNTNKYADYYWLDRTNGAYTSYSGSTLNLYTSIPPAVQSKIVLGTTKIMDHQSGSSYLYFGASYAQIPNTWTKFSGIISGENIMGVDTANKFRFGTKYVNVMVLTNYDAASTTESMVFKNIRFGQTLP